MKALSKIMLFVLLANGMYLGMCQGVVTKFKNAGDVNISLTELDSIFAPALQEDSSKSIFKKPPEFINAYQQLLQDLDKFLVAHEFTWPGKVRCFNRIYFSKEGKIKYFLFDFKPGQLSEEKERDFERLVTDFTREYQFPLQAKSPFAQCSPVYYGANH